MRTKEAVKPGTFVIKVLLHDEMVKVEGHYHKNGGGFVANTAIVDETAFVGKDAMVLENAQVRDRSRIGGSAMVYGKAWIAGDVDISGITEVCGDARLQGKMRVTEGKFFSHRIASNEEARKYLEIMEVLDKELGKIRNRRLMTPSD